MLHVHLAFTPLPPLLLRHLLERNLSIVQKRAATHILSLVLALIYWFCDCIYQTCDEWMVACPHKYYVICTWCMCVIWRYVICQLLTPFPFSITSFSVPSVTSSSTTVLLPSQLSTPSQFSTLTFFTTPSSIFFFIPTYLLRLTTPSTPSAQNQNLLTGIRTIRIIFNIIHKGKLTYAYFPLFSEPR